MTRRLASLACLPLFVFTPLAMGTENDRLTRDERDRVGHLYAKVMQDKNVLEARRAHEQATRHYHEVLRQAMIKRDPKVTPALTKIRINPALLAEAIWEKRNKEILNNLHLPVRRLEKPERQRWDRAMDKLQQKELTKAFSKRLERNYRQQTQLRKEQVRLMGDFKREARRKLLEIDGNLKPILEKLERPLTADAAVAKGAAEEAAQTPTAPPVDPELPDEAEAELVPPMPVPMPAPAGEC